MLKTFSVPFLVLALTVFGGIGCVDSSGNKVYSHGGSDGGDASAGGADGTTSDGGGSDSAVLDDGGGAADGDDAATTNDAALDGVSLDLLGDL